jgi:hypothetical protein
MEMDVLERMKVWPHAPLGATRDFVKYILPNEHGCWEWIGYVRSSGYGMFQSKLAHRVSMLWAYGFTKLHTHHVCRNKQCVNPQHLEPVTVRIHKIEHTNKKTHCIHGHEFIESNIIIDYIGKRSCKQRRYNRTARSPKLRIWASNIDPKSIPDDVILSEYTSRKLPYR